MPVVCCRGLFPEPEPEGTRACVRACVVCEGRRDSGRAVPGCLFPLPRRLQSAPLFARRPLGVRSARRLFDFGTCERFFFSFFFLPFGSVPPGLVSPAPCLTASDPGHQPRPRLPPSPGSAPWPRRVGSFAQRVSAA